MSLLELQKECQALPLVREATGQVGSREYKYLTLGKLHEAVMPVLHEKGFVWVTQPNATGEGAPVLEYALVKDDNVEDTLAGGFVPLLGCKDMQSLGSAITYARRYALLAVLGLCPDEDDDGAATASESDQRNAVPVIPLDRAKAVLEAAQKAGLAEGTDLGALLKAKLVDVGVTSGRIGHLTVDQAEAVEKWIAEQ